uniref:Zinc finger, CCHC-type n=1 Tax=Tanacetum cinerariifolium TaxID=118510 RepID=A0A6L2J4V1_TANCI|nr:zinc finger, CCHC-type [Tanacetum cinerariifolium]
MHFLLMTLKVVYVLTTLMPNLVEDATVEAIRIRAKWENDDYICRGHILNDMSDSLFDVYMNVNSAKELWDSIESKDCRSGQKNNTKAGGSGKGSKEQSYDQVDAIAWWIDSNATTHVCKDCCWFKTFEPIEDGSVLYMGDEHFDPVHHKGSVALEFSSGKTATLFNVLYVPKLPSYIPQQNGVAEKKNRALKEMVNSMLSYTESRDTIFDENRFSSIPRPKDIIPNVQESLRDDHFDDVPSEIPEPQKEEDPRNYNEAMQSWDAAFWKKVIDDEIGSVIENNTWILSDLPPGCKWIFKRKTKVDGTIDKFKARLVIQGFRQKERIDYFDTYAPVARITTIRLLLALDVIHNLVIHKMDVKTAFLNGDLDEDVYMKQPEKFVMPGNEHKVFLLGGDAISWDSKKQICITSSTMESEFIALAAAGDARVWFDDLPHESIDSYNDLRKAFLENSLQQKKCIKDPVEIHNIKQRDGECTEEFMRRYKIEYKDVKGAPKCMKISRFMHGITNPELIKRLHDNIPKSVDEMMRVTTTFLRGEVVASNRKQKKSFPSWKQQEARQKQNFQKGSFRNQQRTERRQDKFTFLTKTPKEILALDKEKFKPPPPMTTPIEKRNASKFYEFNGKVGHTIDECMCLKWQTDEMLKARKLTGDTAAYGRLSQRRKDLDCNPPKISEQTIAIGSTLTEEGWKELCGLLRCNLDIFAWKLADMTRVPRHIAEHRLNICEGCPLIMQKKRGQAPERNKAICTFLGYKVDADGLRVCPNKVEAVLNLPSPKCLKDVQKLNGMLASLNRFLSKSAEKSLPFFKTLKKCMKKSDFQWTAKAEMAFKQMKRLIAELPMLTTPRKKEELIMYLATVKKAINFITECLEDDTLDTPIEDPKELPDPWVLFMDESSCIDGFRAGLIITNRNSPMPSEELKEKSIDEKEILAVVEEEGHTWMTLIYKYLKEEILPKEKRKARVIRRKAGRSQKGQVSNSGNGLFYQMDRSKTCGNYNGSPVIPVEIRMPTMRTKEVDMFTNDEALEVNLDLLENKREHAAIQEAKSKAKMEKYYNTRVHSIIFRLGNLVYRSNEASWAEDGRKLGPKWEGPYEITEALAKGA